MLESKIAVVVPIREITAEADHASVNVWSRVVALLKPALGILYDKFYPSARAWGHDVHTPFSVVFGKQAPQQFLALFKAAREAQSRAVAYHLAGMLSPEDLDKAQQCGDFLIYQIGLGDGDKDKAFHALWHLFLQKGATFPDCGIYYAEWGRAVASQGEIQSIFQRLSDYAICIVTLEKDEGGRV